VNFEGAVLEKIPLSVAIITKNEEENIRDCLQSVAFSGQIVMVDSGSTDATLRIAEEFDCEIYSEVWRGFGPQKQSAIEKCRQPWVLVLDADERIPSATADVIRKIVTDSDRKENGFSFPRKTFSGTVDQTCRLVARSGCPFVQKRSGTDEPCDGS